MGFTFYNDTGRQVSIHPATITHGCQCNSSPIEPFQERIFILPKGKIPWVKMWDYGPDTGLSILVFPHGEADYTDIELTECRENYRAMESMWLEAQQEITDLKRQLNHNRK